MFFFKKEDNSERVCAMNKNALLNGTGEWAEW